MYKSIIVLNKSQYEGTLDFYVIKDIKNRLKKDFNLTITATDIFNKIKENNMQVISTFILATLIRLNPEKELEIVNNFINDNDILYKFENMFKYITDIIENCLPKKNKKHENIFEDEFENEASDWDFDFMEYIWCTTLKRNSFWHTTPRNFFEQLEIYKSVNKIKDKSEDIEYL